MSKFPIGKLDCRLALICHLISFCRVAGTRNNVIFYDRKNGNYIPDVIGKWACGASNIKTIELVYISASVPRGTPRSDRLIEASGVFEQ
jgi:hypothetical protein